MKKRKPVLLNGEALMADGKPLEFDAVNQEELDGKIDAPQTAAVGEVLTVEEVDEDGNPKKWKAAKISGTFVCTFNEGEDGWITCDKTVEEIITANNDGKDVIGHYYGEIYRLSTPFETGGGYGNPIFSNLGVGVLSIIQYDAGHFGINRIRLSDIAPEDAPDPYEVPVYVPTKDGMRWQYGRPLLATDYSMNELTDEEKALMQKNLDALPSPATTQVGQIVKVKAVDADGKVIETETIPHPVLYVTISKTGNTNTSDKTFAEIKSAYDSGCSVFAVVDSFVLPLLGISDNMACFCATTPDRELHRVSVLITESGVSLAYGSFVEGNQGVENAGKILGISNDGNVVPEDKPVQALAGASAPTTATSGVVGQEYYVIVNNTVTEMYVCTNVADTTYTWGKVSLGENGIKYVTQTLTDAQKKQARTNIGAGTSNFSGSYNDLTNKPNIPAATVIDTTLSQSGQAADAKAAGDAIGKKIDAPQTAAVGEVLTVEEVGEDGKPKKWKTAPAADEQKQADWNQNDETAADYVKNRPFYVADEAPLGEVVFTARSVNAITHTVNAMSIKVLRAIFSTTDIHVPRPQIRLFLCGKFYAANVDFNRGNFSFASDEISGHVNYNTGREWYLEFQDNSVSFTVGESYSVAFFDINNKGYVKIPLGYFPDSIFTQESAPVRYGDGNLSTIQGSNTTASANNSHAEGMNTTASGIESHAEGSNTLASGIESHAEGCRTKASGAYSHVEGFETIASGDKQHVQGSYNLSDTTSAHIVGNGTNKQRSNAYTLDWKGNAWFSGNVYVGSTSGTNKDKGSKKLVDTSELSELLGMVQNYAIPNPATAQVGQIVKVKSVDESGKITETETVDMPMQKTLKWVTVHSSDLTETKRELIISTDTDGKSIIDYNPVGLSLIVSTPADATVESNNGSPWVYPSATKADNAIRVIGNISGWKTIARDSAFVFNGGSSAMSCSGNVNTSLATYKLEGYALDGVRIFFNSANDHLPVGTHVEVAILCEVEK